MSDKQVQGTDLGVFRFCPYCAAELIPAPLSDRVRPRCPRCGFVQYRNPVIGVAVILRRGDEVLLGRWSGSYRGQWCIPCGYVEWDEDVREAHTVGIWFLGHVEGGKLMAGDDLDEVRFFGLDDLPEPLAFPTDRCVLAQLRADRSSDAGTFTRFERGTT